MPNRPGSSAGRFAESGRRRTPEDHHAPLASGDPATRTVAAHLVWPPDPVLELSCIGCTLIYDAGRWTPDPGCVFRSRPL